MSQVLLNTLDGDTRVLRLERAPETPLTLGGKREALPHILAGELGERLEQVFHGYACG